MKKILTALTVSLTVLLWFRLVAAEPVKMTWYSGGEKSFRFNPMPDAVNSWKIRLKGVSSARNLWFQFKSNRTGTVHDIKLDSGASGVFNYSYVFKDGPGSYTVFILGNNSGASYQGFCTFTVTSMGTFPANLPEMDISAKILSYADSMMGKTVGRGECWDLIQEGLDRSMADWKRPTDFGIRLDPAKDEIRPGDIVQMYSLTLKYSNRIEYFGLPKHTAIIHKVLSKGKYELIQQNISGKRFVQLGIFDSTRVTAGRYELYRPQAGLILP
jgi:hypothetical protein